VEIVQLKDGGITVESHARPANNFYAKLDIINFPTRHITNTLQIWNSFIKQVMLCYLINLMEGGDHVMLWMNERGQGLVEYALILVLVAVVVFAVLMFLGPIIGDVFSRLIDSFPSGS
jgi:pilus assembly protein Flp/PilA